MVNNTVAEDLITFIIFLSIDSSQAISQIYYIYSCLECFSVISFF